MIKVLLSLCLLTYDQHLPVGVSEYALQSLCPALFEAEGRKRLGKVELAMPVLEIAAQMAANVLKDSIHGVSRAECAGVSASMQSKLESDGLFD